MRAVAFFPRPSFAVTVMVAVPTFSALIVPSPDTESTSLADETNSTALFAASSGSTLTFNFKLSPVLMVVGAFPIVTPLTGTPFTFTLQVAVYSPSFVFRVITASPAPTAFTVIVPFLAETVATFVLPLVQVTVWSVAPEGIMP